MLGWTLLWACTGGPSRGWDPQVLDAHAADLDDEAIAWFPGGVGECPEDPAVGLVEPIDVQPILGRYCRYRPAPGNSFDADPLILLQSTFGTDVDQAEFDALTVTPMAGDTGGAPIEAPLSSGDLAAHWLNTMDGVVGPPGEVPSPGVLPRVEILDSLGAAGPDPSAPLSGADVAESGLAPTDPRAHGARMLAMAWDTLCARTRCPADVRVRQVLGRRGPPPVSAPRSRGNQAYWGSFFDLARGIQGAVDDWVVAGAQGQLILNLSLAWHPLWGGSVGGAMELAGNGEEVDLLDGGTTTFQWASVNPSDFPLGVRLVHETLVYARCHGALVFAAAGNATPGERGTDGPLLPAGWEGYPTDEIDCVAVRRHPGADAVGLPAPADMNARMAAVPLVVSVGALMPKTPINRGDEMTDAPIARTGSRPTLMATGYAGVHHPFERLDTGPPLTGTSVATILVSSTAALVAAQDADRAPADLLGRLVGGPDGGVEAARHDLGMVVSPVYAASPLTATGMGQAVWVRPCAALNPAATVCGPDIPDQASPSVVEVGDGADGSLAVGAVIALPSDELYPPTMVPTIIEQPDHMLCPDCILMTRTGNPTRVLVYARFPDPKGSVENMGLRVRTASQEIGLKLEPSLLAKDGDDRVLLLRLSVGAGAGGLATGSGGALPVSAALELAIDAGNNTLTYAEAPLPVLSADPAQ